jgi:hypothetical protein
MSKFWTLVNIVVSTLVAADLLLQTRNTIAQPVSELPSGVYLAQGTMYARSHREVLSRGSRLCLKIVDQASRPNTEPARITISSVSVRGGKLYIDALNTELKIFPSGTNSPGNTGKPGFNDGQRATWFFEGRTVGDINPTRDIDLLSCLVMRGAYQKSFTR